MSSQCSIFMPLKTCFPGVFRRFKGNIRKLWITQFPPTPSPHRQTSPIGYFSPILLPSKENAGRLCTKSSICEAQCAESVLTIQKELNTIGHRQLERPRTWDHPYSFRITSRITIPKFLLNFLLNVYRENLWINEAPVTEKCIFHQEFTLHPQEKVFPRFLPLQNREELFHQQKGGRKPWIKELMQGNNY